MPHDLSNAAWKKSSYTAQQGECVELAGNLPDIVPVRDSKDPDGPKLTFARGAFAEFLGRVRTGALDLR